MVKILKKSGFGRNLDVVKEGDCLRASLKTLPMFTLQGCHMPFWPLIQTELTFTTDLG